MTKLIPYDVRPVRLVPLLWLFDDPELRGGLLQQREQTDFLWYVHDLRLSSFGFRWSGNRRFSWLAVPVKEPPCP